MTKCCLLDFSCSACVRLLPNNNSIFCAVPDPVLSFLVLSCLVLSCLVSSCVTLCRVPEFRCVVCLALSLFVLSVVHLLCCLLSPGCSSVVCWWCVLGREGRGGRKGCMYRTRLRVHVQNVSVCTSITPTCFIHVGLVPVHTETF